MKEMGKHSLYFQVTGTTDNAIFFVCANRLKKVLELRNWCKPQKNQSSKSDFLIFFGNRAVGLCAPLHFMITVTYVFFVCVFVKERVC